MKFDWQLVVFKLNQVNVYVVFGGKVVFYMGIVDKLNLIDVEIVVVMGYEMVYVLEEYLKSKVGVQVLMDLVLGIGLSVVGVG